jgi:NADPH:quinone reductase-like Zn-dependent oxidoreductase
MRIHRVSLALTIVGACAALPALSAPEKMDAIVQTSATAMQLQSVDTPKPGANQILIKVYAAGVNPVDWKRRPAQTPLAAGGVLAPIPGFDVAGVIDSVGTGVTNWKAGDAVISRVTGAFAQYAVVNAEEVAPKPKRLTFEQAGAMPIAGVAGLALAEGANIQPGQRVAIIGAAGGAGSAAVDAAHARGAKLIVSVHSSQQEWLKEQKVEESVAYDKDNVAQRIQGVDAALNTADGQADAALGYVKRGGYLVSISGLPGADKCSAAGVTCVQIRGTVPGKSQGESLRMLSKLAEDGKYTPRVTSSYPLAEAAAAQQLAQSGNIMGKIVMIVDPVRAKDR